MNPVSHSIPALVKDSSVVVERRRQLVDAAVGLFIHKGFHATTTREIAQAAGWSVGAVYQYIKRKEDILYLVCEAIHADMEEALQERISTGATARATLKTAIAEYLRTCDRMQDAILLIYRETSSLAPEYRNGVLANEARITAIFESILRQGAKDGTLAIKGSKAIALMAHNIVVLGHMWAFRRWFLAKQYTLNEYIRVQTSLILNELVKRE